VAPEPERIRDGVCVVGAGFSAGLGYPLTKSLLIDALSRLDEEPRTQLRRIIEFHHPYFTMKRKTTFPDIEQLLTEIAVNLDLFDASRPAEGTFFRCGFHNQIEGRLKEEAPGVRPPVPPRCSSSTLTGTSLGGLTPSQARRSRVHGFRNEFKTGGLNRPD